MLVMVAQPYAVAMVAQPLCGSHGGPAIVCRLWWPSHCVLVMVAQPLCGSHDGPATVR